MIHVTPGFCARAGGKGNEISPNSQGAGELRRARLGTAIPKPALRVAIRAVPWTSGSTVVATADGRAGILSIPASATMYQGLGVAGAERIGFFYDHNATPTNWAMINSNGHQILRNMIASYQAAVPTPEITNFVRSGNGDVYVTFTPGGAGYELLSATNLAAGLTVNAPAVFDGTNTFWVPAAALSPGQGYFRIKRSSP